MGFFKKKNKEEKEQDNLKNITYENFPFLDRARPKERYVFHSDYFDVDGGCGTIMTFIHREGANDGFPAFWGVNMIPGGLDADITTILFEQTRRKTDSWIATNQSRTERVAKSNESEQEKGGTKMNKQKVQMENADLEIVASELHDGAAYLHVHFRLMVKAPTIEKLDEAVDKIKRLYVDRFKTLNIEHYPGEQRRELSSLWKNNALKRGRGYYFTSTEYAGNYNLVTNGLSDYDGEFVGSMTGDVNNSAVLFNVDGYDHHIVVANDNFHHGLNRVYVSDLWGSKLGQSVLLNNRRVVHIVLDGVNLDDISPKLDNITARINMQRGDVNMFEMFGDTENELSIFASQMEKIKLMAEQAFETTSNDRSIIRGSLEEILTKFYISEGMWAENAKENRDSLRVVGIPHFEVPTLDRFTIYLDTRHKALLNAAAQDTELLHAYNVLRSIFKSMLSNNGDLFNQITNQEIDKVIDKPRVIYDFSALMLRGEGIAMAQLVNIIGYAVGNLGYGDTVVIHGVERIKSESVKKYMVTQFEHLFQKGGRVAYLYNSIDKMIKDREFNEFDKANYTVLGNMTENVLSDYQKSLGQTISPDLASLLTRRGENICYIRRDYDNVIFRQDLSLGLGLNLDKSKKKKRRRRGGV